MKEPHPHFSAQVSYLSDLLLLDSQWTSHQRTSIQAHTTIDLSVVEITANHFLYSLSKPQVDCLGVKFNICMSAGFLLTLSFFFLYDVLHQANFGYSHWIIRLVFDGDLVGYDVGFTFSLYVNDQAWLSLWVYLVLFMLYSSPSLSLSLLYLGMLDTSLFGDYSRTCCIESPAFHVCWEEEAQLRL